MSNYNNCDRSTFSRTRVCKPLMEYALEKSEELHYQNVNLEVRVSNVKQLLCIKIWFKNVAVRKDTIAMVKMRI